jgi:hypothetical protein
MPRSNRYIAQGSTRTTPFLKMVSVRVTGSREVKEDGDGLYYLGGGYWRILLEYPEHGLWKLINPDLSQEQIDTVSDGICVLLNKAEGPDKVFLE